MAVAEEGDSNDDGRALAAAARRYWWANFYSQTVENGMNRRRKAAGRANIQRQEKENRTHGQQEAAKSDRHSCR
jgi:hypothetical protein